MAVTTTLQRLNDALRDYIAETWDGGILTDHVIVAAATTMQDFGTSRTIYAFIAPPQQPPHVTLGLINYAADRASIIDEDDDDD